MKLLAALSLLITMNAYGSMVYTNINVEYATKSNGQKTYADQQALSLIDHEADHKRNFAVDFNLNRQRKDGRPLMMTLTNIWAYSKDHSNPHVDVRFSFPTTGLVAGKTYTCTQGYSDNSECRVQLTTSRLDLGVPTEKSICKMRVETNANLDFANVFNASMNTVSVFPATIYRDAANGAPFAVAFVCTDGQQETMKGYFLHNTSIVPQI